MLGAIWKFVRPHTIRGTILGTTALVTKVLLTNPELFTLTLVPKALLGQGLILVHFSAQLEPCLTQKHPRPPKHPLNTGYTTPTRTPYPIKRAQVELSSERV